VWPQKRIAEAPRIGGPGTTTNHRPGGRTRRNRPESGRPAPPASRCAPEQSRLGRPAPPARQCTPKPARIGAARTASQAVQPETGPGHPDDGRVERHHRRVEPDQPRLPRPLPGWATPLPRNSPEPADSARNERIHAQPPDPLYRRTGSSRRKRSRHHPTERDTPASRRLPPVRRYRAPNPVRGPPPRRGVHARHGPDPVGVRPLAEGFTPPGGVHSPLLAEHRPPTR
jgi:hypothetical protein